MSEIVDLTTLIGLVEDSVKPKHRTLLKAGVRTQPLVEVVIDTPKFVFVYTVDSDTWSVKDVDTRCLYWGRDLPIVMERYYAANPD